MTKRERAVVLVAAEVDAEMFRDFAKVPASFAPRSAEMDAFCKNRFDSGQMWKSAGALHLMSDAAAWSYVHPVCRIKIDPKYLLARFGEAALSSALASGPLDALRDVVESVETTTAVARWLEGDMRRPIARGARNRALAYFVRHPKSAAIVLVPMAVSREKEKRRRGVLGLREIAKKHPDVVHEVSNAYGDDARVLVAKLLRPPR